MSYIMPQADLHRSVGLAAIVGPKQAVSNPVPGCIVWSMDRILIHGNSRQAIEDQMIDSLIRNGTYLEAIELLRHQVGHIYDENADLSHLPEMIAAVDIIAKLEEDLETITYSKVTHLSGAEFFAIPAEGATLEISANVTPERVHSCVLALRGGPGIKLTYTKLRNAFASLLKALQREGVEEDYSLSFAMS